MRLASSRFTIALGRRQGAAILTSFIAAAYLLMAPPLPADTPAAPDVLGAISDPGQVAQRYREVVAQPQFAPEDGTANPHVEDLLARWFKRLGERIGDFKYGSRMPAFESLLMSLLVVISISLLFYVVVRLMRGHSWTPEERRSRLSTGSKRPAPESYDDEIRQAVSTRDWHAAWLASWRQFLARLEHGALVDPDRTRTNREYLGQLRARAMPGAATSLVGTLVDTYDRFIYGRAPIAEGDWTDFRRQIEEAALLLHLRDGRPRTES